MEACLRGEVCHHGAHGLGTCCDAPCPLCLRLPSCSNHVPCEECGASWVSLVATRASWGAQVLVAWVQVARMLEVQVWQEGEGEGVSWRVAEVWKAWGQVVSALEEQAVLVVVSGALVV